MVDIFSHLLSCSHLNKVENHRYPDVMDSKKVYLPADVGVTFTGTGVGVSGQIQPNGKYLM